MRVRAAAPNLLDRLVGYFAPGLAVERIRDRTMLSMVTGSGAGGYAGGKRDRRATKNWRPGNGSANADLLPELDTLRSRNRDLVRNVPIASGAVSTNKTHVIGDGLALNATCDRDALGISQERAAAHNKAAEREWATFCETADFTGVQHLADMQYMLFGAVLDSGDVFVLRRYRDVGTRYALRLQAIEADRVTNPMWRADTTTLAGGIEHDSDGVPVAVHIADQHPGDIRRTSMSWRRVQMRFEDSSPVVLHLFDRSRPDLARGVPYLAPVIEMLKSLGDFTDAEVRSALVAAMFAVFVEKSPDAESSPLPTTGEGSNGKDEVELGSGAIIDLAEGEKITVASGARPNPQFDPFMMAMFRQIGVALELPVELLIKHFTASYSASRAALEMAWHTFRRRRSWFARTLLQPVYEMVIEEAVLRGYLDCPGFEDPLLRAAWCKATWSGPVRLSLNPKLEAEADEIDLRNHLKTRQQVMTERTGGDFDQKIEQGKREKAAIDDAFPAAVPAPPPSTEGSPQVDEKAEPEEDKENDEP
ncbi:phage portal protein [Mesorhizobium sp. J428]|uniref:phage portal protein n=1 Tax=Mesorhizobium sp. J428 TaxID=2898440 RepID=UPI00215152A9|nr:phage portal protein [Mesorhizobium sp. J428]MCR5859717.1 phage portal protein [Mesorhizobium sp. J428]